jgi:hypothetical protein
MSVLDTDTIDFVYVEEDTGDPVVVVSDPMTWKQPDEEGHLELLREKLNSQIMFVETGQLSTLCPRSDGRTVRVEVIARHSLSPMAEEFYSVAADIMRQANIDLQFRLCDA